jgi:hypothetical protein
VLSCLIEFDASCVEEARIVCLARKVVKSSNDGRVELTLSVMTKVGKLVPSAGICLDSGGSIPRFY